MTPTETRALIEEARVHPVLVGNRLETRALLVRIASALEDALADVERLRSDLAWHKIALQQKAMNEERCGAMFEYAGERWLCNLPPDHRGGHYTQEDPLIEPVKP